MKKSKILLGTLLSGAVILSGCSSKEEQKKEEMKEVSQETQKEKISTENIKKIVRKVTTEENKGYYTTYSFIFLNSSDWKDLAPEKINDLSKKWLEKREASKEKSLAIYNEDTKKILIIPGTDEMIVYKNIDLGTMSELENKKVEDFNYYLTTPTDYMYLWNNETKEYKHIETQELLNLN